MTYSWTAREKKQEGTSGESKGVTCYWLLHLLNHHQKHRDNRWLVIQRLANKNTIAIDFTVGLQPPRRCWKWKGNAVRLLLQHVIGQENARWSTGFRDSRNVSRTNGYRTRKRKSIALTFDRWVDEETPARYYQRSLTISSSFSMSTIDSWWHIH